MNKLPSLACVSPSALSLLFPFLTHSNGIQDFCCCNLSDFLQRFLLLLSSSLPFDALGCSFLIIFLRWACLSEYKYLVCVSDISCLSFSRFLFFLAFFVWLKLMKCCLKVANVVASSPFLPLFAASALFLYSRSSCCVSFCFLCKELYILQERISKDGRKHIAVMNDSRRIAGNVACVYNKKKRKKREKKLEENPCPRLHVSIFCRIFPLLFLLISSCTLSLRKSFFIFFEEGTFKTAAKCSSNTRRRCYWNGEERETTTIMGTKIIPESMFGRKTMMISFIPFQWIEYQVQFLHEGHSYYTIYYVFSSLAALRLLNDATWEWFFSRYA